MIPVYVLTGFLGAGKTTLLRDVLAQQRTSGQALSWGLIVNELGEIGVDGELLGADAARQIELPGGCVCCQLSDELDATITSLLQERPNLRAIVVETTGIAEPLGVAWTIERLNGVRLAAILTVVDAENFATHLQTWEAVRAQVRDADVVLLNKRELVSPAAYAAAAQSVREISSRAALMMGTRTELAQAIHSVLANDELTSGTVGQPGREAHLHLGSIAVPANDVYDLERLEELLAELPTSCVRVKGLVCAFDPRLGKAAPTRWYEVHRVGARVSSAPAAAPSVGRMVMIGEHPTATRLLALLGESKQ